MMNLQHEMDVVQDVGGMTKVSGAAPGSVVARAEKLLVVCATAIENGNAAVAERSVLALREISSLVGEPRERVTAYFVDALVALLQAQTDLKNQPPKFQWIDKKLCFNELSHLIDSTPFYRFGYLTANATILASAVDGIHMHILDLSTSHCMQWPTLIDALSNLPTPPAALRLTVPAPTPLPTAPHLQASYTELGHRLTWWAHKKLRVPNFQFQVLDASLESIRLADVEVRQGEALVVNCSLRLHHLAPGDARDRVVELLRELQPRVVTLFEEDCDTMSASLVERVAKLYDHEWMLFDYLATYNAADRVHHERMAGLRIKNVVTLCERPGERLESKAQWRERMSRGGFRGVRVEEDGVDAVREMVADYGAAWGVKVDEDGFAVGLTWKGHSLAFASAWEPVAPTRS